MWYRKAKERVDSQKIGIYPLRRTYTRMGLDYIIMSSSFPRIERFCHDFDIPIRKIRRDKRDKYGYYYVVLRLKRAREMDKHVLEREPNFFGKSWKEY